MSKAGQIMQAIFDLELMVQPEHIDRLGHVNNVTYMHWMQDVSMQHVEKLGLGIEQYIALNHAMVAVEHHVQYRKAAFEGDHIILRTWLDALDSLYLSRQYVFYRPADHAILFVGKTKWACVEITTGRPKRMSPTFMHAYAPLDQKINPIDFSVRY